MKTSSFNSKVLVASFLLSQVCLQDVSAHSWLACSDYRGDVNYFEQDKCFGWARRWEDRGSALTAPQPKGYQIAIESNNSPRAFANNGCDRPMGSSSSAFWKDGYSAEFPHATYEQGQVYCMTWSMQNHATTPEDCTNNQAKSDAAARDSLYLYISNVNPTVDPSQDEFLLRNINEVAGLANDCNPHNEAYSQEEACQLGLEKQQEARDCKGFQRSPAFCENTGQAMGTGCVFIPEDMPTGHYVGQWYWNTTFVRPTFVQETAYKSCFDFEVVAAGTMSGSTYASMPEPGTKGTPVGSLPCVNNLETFEAVLHRTLPTMSPSMPPNNDPPNGSCSPLYERCGGEGWNGPTCCVDGTECIEFYVGWPQCMPATNEQQPVVEIEESEESEEESEESQEEPSQCSALWTRCGGENWTGSTCCQEGECIEQHPNWFVCMV